MSDSLSVKGARNSSSAFYGKCAQKNGANICSSILKWALCFSNQIFTCQDRVCVCECVRSMSGCMFWFVSCIEPVGAYLKLIICNVSFCHVDCLVTRVLYILIYARTGLYCHSAVFHLCAAIFALIIISRIGLCLISRVPPPRTKQKNHAQS